MAVSMSRDGSTWTGHRQNFVAVAFLMVVLLLSSPTAMLPVSASTLPSTISYYVTVRDFIAAGCVRTASPTTKTSLCPNDPDVLNLVDAGTVSGHRDFERNFGALGVTRAYPSPFSTQEGKQFPVVQGAGLGRPYVLSTLNYGTTGIGKMRFCKGQEGYACDFNAALGSRSVFDETSFSTWYEDDATFSRRVAYIQPLFLNKTTLQYSYNPSENRAQDPDIDGFYDPITENNLNGWARSGLEKTGETKHKYWFTTEIHTTFEYKGGEQFTFAGDDDVHVFINGRLAINLGGVHSSTSATIRLDDFKNELGIDIGTVYDFDLFHAERQTKASNYGLTTTLAEKCNVVNSGLRSQGRDVQNAIDWTSTGTTRNQDWFVLNGPGYGTFPNPNQKRFQLMSPGNANVVSYLFHSTRHNVGSGFSLTFKFRMSGTGHGFSVLIHDRIEGLQNMNGGTGPNLGIKNIENSVGILFDTCPEYPAACNARQIRTHYNVVGDRRNSPDVSTRKTFDGNVVQEWNDGHEHLVEIFYYGNPARMEIYVNRSLRVVERNFSMKAILGGNDASVGFASTSSDLTGLSVSISDVVMTTVKVVDRFTEFDEDIQLLPKSFVANGRDKIEFKLKTNDACGKGIEFGGLQNRVQGRLVAVVSNNDSVAQSNGGLRRLQGSNPTSGNDTQQLELLGEVIDNNNGEYSIVFSTSIVADFSVHLAFGTNCTWTGTAFLSGSDCFAVNIPEAAVSIPFITATPTTFEQAQSLDQAAITGLGVGAGVVFSLGGVFLVAGMRMRKRWRRDKQFIEAGKLSALEKDMAYVGDAELDALQNRLQKTMHDLHRERAKRNKSDDQQGLIDELLRQKGELQELVRRIKIRQRGGDPNSPEYMEPATLGERVRKSFAASRISNRLSLSAPSIRLSRGISMNLSALGLGSSPEGNETVSPLTRFRSSVSRGFSRMYSGGDTDGSYDSMRASNINGDVLGASGPKDAPLSSSNPIFAKLVANKAKPPPPPSSSSLARPFRIDEEI